MVLKEHTFAEITTYEYPMWRRSYISGAIKAVVDEIEAEAESEKGCQKGRGKLVEIISIQRPKLYDDYTDLHGGVDSISRSATLEEVKKMVEGKEGIFIHEEKIIPPRHMFTIKEQFPLEIKPIGSPFG